MQAKKTNYLVGTDEGQQTEEQLTSMQDNPVYTTESTYSSNTELFADNTMSFVEKHMRYLNTHPAVSPKMYIANLRIMTKVRT